MTGPPVLGRDRLAGLAELCARAVPDAPDAGELDGALFDPVQPAVVRGDPDVGVVATVTGPDGGHIRLLAVDPAHRGGGHGRALVAAAEADARAAGHRSLTTGADAPFHLWPGIASTATPLLCLFERLGYERVGANVDVRIDLGALPPDPGGHRLAGPADAAGVDAWIAAHYPGWRAEVMRALRKGNLVLAGAPAGGTGAPGEPGAIEALCAFWVNRSGVLGPVAARPDLVGRGRARPALVGALHEMARRGATGVDVSWVGPLRPYVALGGRISTVWLVHRKLLG